jgi:hypothetical protein
MGDKEIFEYKSGIVIGIDAQEEKAVVPVIQYENFFLLIPVKVLVAQVVSEFREDAGEVPLIKCGFILVQDADVRIGCIFADGSYYGFCFAIFIEVLVFPVGWFAG